MTLLEKSIVLVFLCVFTNTVFGQKLNLEKYAGKNQTVTKMRIASASILPDKWDKQENWTRIEAMVRKAKAEGGANLVVTPEGVLEGYVVNEVNAEKDSLKKVVLLEKFMALGEPIDGPYIQKASDLCVELRIYLVLGFLERREKKLLNSAILIDPEGDIIGRYSKTHFAQGYQINPDAYQASDTYPVFDTPFGKVGMIICYDRQLPEPARIMAIKGAQVLFVPAYGSYSTEHGWNTILMRTRAYENRFPVVFCNPYQSILITSRGDIKAMGNAGEIVYYDIGTDPDLIKGRFRNRRPSTYRELFELNDKN